ncbi:MAG: twin-arginine translocase subunit TatC [Prolixibacteraceae bacterium]|jgi:sec-independent protein translocase protein TatC|nr:twin-arginine translocase subunit TatC [Prolixibacteraceae bacterium]HPJ79129.1 twin-arginine translocase subunit TatC [Prolixibacteraceae bacterium]HRV87797.1 twin-arginine translocase subunit TatC [Prolixibacteraceae bacterium]
MGKNSDRERKAIERKDRKEKEKVGEMSFLDHLEELRWHIIRSLIAVFVLAVFAFIIQDFIFQELIFKPKSPDFWTNRMFAKMAEFFNTDALRINQKEIELINIKLPGQFNMSMWTAMIAGLIMAAPVVFWEFWKFIKPALYENEKKVATGAVFYTTFLFILGLLFGYYLIVPLSIQFFGNYSISPDVSNQINITSYISMVVSIVFASGVVFLLPVFSYSLSKVGLLTPEFMRTYRKHAIVVLVLLAAIITPPDVFSQILVALPLLLLYEVSIFISARVVKNMEKKERMAANAS